MTLFQLENLAKIGTLCVIGYGIFHYRNSISSYIDSSMIKRSDINDQLYRERTNEEQVQAKRRLIHNNFMHGSYMPYGYWRRSRANEILFYYRNLHRQRNVPQELADIYDRMAAQAKEDSAARIAKRIKMFKTLAQPCIRTTKYPIHQIGVRKSIFPSIIFQSKCGQKRKLARIGSLRTKNELTKPSIDVAIPIETIRNVGIIAHIDAGKTTTTERMLYYSGYTDLLGDVDDGDTITDYMDQEVERGITIKAAAITFKWRDHRINLIDTPGHVDFTVEVERAVRVLDGAVAIFDGITGVEAQTKTVWKQANRYKVPRVAYINKLDKQGANFQRAIHSMEEKLECNPLVIQIPVGEGDHFRGVIDLITMQMITFSEEDKGKHLTYTPVDKLEKELSTQAKKAREELIEGVANLDDEVADLYIEGKDIPPEIMKRALRRITIAQTGVPVLCGSSLQNKGVQPVMDAIVDFLPSPVERPLPKAITIGSKEKSIEIPLTEKGPMCGLAFKVINDPNRGPLVFIRVYSGKLKARSVVKNMTKGTEERVAKLFQMHANIPEEIEFVSAGNIAVCTGFKNTSTGDTLFIDSPSGSFKKKGKIILEGVKIPTPVFFCAIEPETSAAQQALENALSLLSREDPSLEVRCDEETGQTLVSGMGELHLDIIRDRLKREFKLNVAMGDIQIAYRETMLDTYDRTHVLQQKIAEKEYFAKVSLIVEPNERGKGNEFIVQLDPNKCVPSDKEIKRMVEPVRDAVNNALLRGSLLGFPMEDMKVTFVGGELNPSLAKEISITSFYKCTTQLMTSILNESAEKNRTQLLEPYMTLQVSTDCDNLGTVLADITTARRGKVKDTQNVGNDQIISAEVPLSEMIGYASNLRTITRGNSTFFMEFNRYELLSGEQRDAIVLKLRGY